MNRDALLTVGVAVCCLLAIGATSTAMEAAVETTPDEAVDLSYESLPIDGDTAERLNRQIRPADSGEEGQVEAGQSAPDGSDESRSSGDAGPEDSSADARSGEDSDARGGDASQSSSGRSAGSDGAPDGAVERASDLLGRFLDLLLAGLSVLLLVAVLAVVVRYRARIAAALRAVADRFGLARPDRGEPTTASGRRLPPADPENDVEGAWYTMARRLGLRDRPSMTPRECVDTAERAGVDTDPVERLTRLFERVRYGDARVTDDMRERSKQSLREVLDQLPERGVR